MVKKSSKQLFKKLFLHYTTITLCIVLALMAYFVFASRARILEINLNYMKLMNDQAASYLTDSAKTVDNIHNELYQTEDVLEDLLHYLTDSEEEYQRYRLNTYASQASFAYTGYDGFMEKLFQSDSSIQSIELISYENITDTFCYPQGKFHKQLNCQSRLGEVEKGQLAKYGSFSFVKEIRNPSNMQSIGCMVVTFGNQAFSNMQEHYEKGLEMLVYNSLGTAVYHSSEQYEEEVLISKPKSLNIYTFEENVKDYTVMTFWEKEKANYLPPSQFFTIVGIVTAAAVIGVFFIWRHLKGFTERINYILEGMEKVTTGDLSIRLEGDGQGDELDLISMNFNSMCEELDRYIEKSYLAEIEQKNAELEALQSQINPHFLYNTLESIRMKAICNGDKEVGKMLYSMAVIYRSQIKEADFITIVQELHYCKKYLELFEYRYPGKFRSSVECPEEYMNCMIIKFILQPVIENYFIHGIRAQEEGNELCIFIRKEEELLVIHVSDNGKGMEEAKLKKKNAELMENNPQTRKTIGLMNVNRRLKAVYGRECGVYLSHSSLGGLDVNVRIGLGEKENENSNAS